MILGDTRVDFIVILGVILLFLDRSDKESEHSFILRVNTLELE